MKKKGAAVVENRFWQVRGALEDKEREGNIVRERGRENRVCYLGTREKDIER
jgi:hypothetical protein